MAETRMALKLKQMLLELDNLLLKFERVAMIMMIILADKFEWSSIHDFSLSSMHCLELSRHRRLGIDASHETKKREALEKMVIELQILLFRMQRFGIFSFILLPRNFAGASAPLFSISNVFYLICFELQLDINPRLLEHDLLFWIERLATVLMFMEPYRGIIAYSLSSLLFLFTNSCYIIAHFTNPKKRSTHTKSEETSGQRIQKLRQQKFSNTAYKFGETSTGEQSKIEKARMEDFPQTDKLEVEQIAPKEENNKRETNKAEKSDKEMAKVGDEPKENLEVREESPKEEKSKWEEDLVEADDQLKEKSEVAEEEPKEENNSREDDWGEADDQLKEKSEVAEEEPKEENNSREDDWGEADDQLKEKSEVAEEEPKEENNSREDDWGEADDQLKEKSEVAEEAPKEQNNSWEDDWGEADEQLKEKLEVDHRPAEKEEENGWEDWLLPEFGRFVNWEDVNIANDNSNWGEELRQADEASSFNDNSSKEIEDNLEVKTAENVRIDSEEVVAEIEAERLKAENENLKREKKALDEKLISESLVYEDSRCVWETQNQKLNAMLHEAYLESEGLVKELENHCKLVKEMVTRCDSYEEDGRRWEQEKREMSAKLEALTAASEKDKSVVQNCKEDLRKEWEEEKASLTQRLSAAYFACNYYYRVIKNYEQTNLRAQTPASEKDQDVAQNCTEDHQIKWEDEKTALTQQLSEANSLCQYYYDVALHNAETALKLEEEKNTRLRGCEEKHLRLTQRNADLAKNLQHETDSARCFRNLVYKLDEKCWMLEDEKINLTAKLCAATASSELYRSMLHDKGC
ncbi:hypothetical protein ACFX2G_035813 [Malus domestica]